MTETTASDPPDPASRQTSRLSTAFRNYRRSAGRFLIALVVALIAYTFGHRAGVHEIDSYKIRNSQLLGENGKLTADKASMEAQVASLRAQLKSAEEKIKAILPTENTHTINANESRTVADGRLTVGLIGTPRSESVDLNINNKQQTAAAGEVINFAPDSSTNCRIEVVSFYVLKSQADLRITCAQATP